MTDAPLFGFRSRRQVSALEPGVDGVEHVLPPRRHADYLMDIYWHHIHPVEPFLDYERFHHSYRALFEGTSTDENTEERIFISTLNTIFALTTQLQEDGPPEEREAISNRYFQRAWAGVGLETVMREEPGSPLLVQCLLLMGRYLQCTNNPHQMWMAVGSAVRIAQSLGLHNHEYFSSSSTPSFCQAVDRRLATRLWHSCVYMDR